MVVVGLTGNFSSGKSEVSRLFKKMGALGVVDADALAKKLTQKGTPIYRAIVKTFGSEYVQKDKQLDRRKLARHVFNDPKELRKLTILTHPGVILETYRAIEKARHKKGALILDVPLLFESRMEKMSDFIVVVKADKSVMLERTVKKGIPRDLAEKILASQWPFSRKAKLADAVIDNNGTLKELETQVKDVWKRITILIKGRNDGY